MREIVLGTAGHVDHGKTSLIRALTGIDTDRLKEEKRRGITIELGFAFLDLPCGHRLGIIDVPGHEKFVKNMVAGAAGIDLVAFVVAADEGIMPQTREHFEICSLLGIKRGLLVITKIDMVEADWLEMVQDEVRQFCIGSFLEEAPMVLVSSVSGQGIEAVKEELDRMIRTADFAEAFGPFRLPVDRIFSMKGFGAVVTGTSISGRIKVGDDVCLYPSLQPAKIRGIQVHGQDVSEVEAGHRTAINLQGLEKEFVARGDILASPNSLTPSYMLDADFTYLSGNAKPLKNRTRIRVHLGTAEIMGRLVLLEQEEARPGERLNVQILLEEAVGTWPGDHYVVRSYSPVQTIGGGVVLNNAPSRKRRRFKEVNREIFALYHAGNTDALAAFHLDESDCHGMTFNELEIRLGIFGKRLKKILERPISTSAILVVDSDRQWMISAQTMGRLKAETLAILSLSHQENPLKEGIGKEELRSRLLQGLEPKLFQMMINSLVKEAKIVQEGATVRLIGHQVALKEDEERARRELAALLQKAGLSPPTKKEIVTELSKYSKTLILQILELMVRDQQVVKVSEDLYFDQHTVTTLQEKLVALLTKEGEMDAQGFKALTGISRKYSIPLLEYFDKLKITIRVGDKRVLRGR
jgi:selenocysteine-specific elongation factor